MRTSNVTLNKQDEGKKKKETPERHLINESRVYVGEGAVLPPPTPHHACVRTPPRVLFVYQLFVPALLCEQRDLCVEGSGGRQRGGLRWLGGKCLLLFRQK